MFLGILLLLAAIQIYTAVPTFAFNLDPDLDPATPFVTCDHQTYALCAEASCFVFDGVAHWRQTSCAKTERIADILVACNSDIGIAFMYHDACVKESFA